MDLGFELVGRNATWTFHADRVVIEYASSLGLPRLLRRIGRRVVPDEAIADARLARDLRLRASGDPLVPTPCPRFLTTADPPGRTAGTAPDDLQVHRRHDRAARQ